MTVIGQGVDYEPVLVENVYKPKRRRLDMDIHVVPADRDLWTRRA